MAIVFGLVVGLALGLTGGGGSILAVPLLVYGLGLAPKTAAATALAAVALTAAAGAGDAARARLLEIRPALIFAATGMIAAPAGVMLADRVADAHIVTGFAVLMLLVGARMWWRAGSHPDEAAVVRAGLSPGRGDRGPVCRYSEDGRLRLNAPCTAALAGAGVVAGLLAGFFGVGGGFLIVPALLAVTGMGIHRAVATSLLVITLIGCAGLAAAYAGGREIPWFLTGLFVVGGIAGMGVGRRLAGFLAGPGLQRAFAAGVLVLAVAMLAERLLGFGLANP